MIRIAALYLFCSALASQAQTFTTLAPFPNAQSIAPSLLQGADGNLYGVEANGPNGYMLIFQLTLSGTFTTLYTFGNFYGTVSMLQASDGNFYGVTQDGGTGSCPGFAGPIGCGIFFKLTPAGVFSALYNFTGAADGSSPSALVQAADGNLYGVTTNGGSASCGCGTFFQVTTAGVFTTLFTFGANSSGGHPLLLIAGADGNFYGATGTETFFKMTPGGALTNLANFNQITGVTPYSLLQGSDGNFYGLTSAGGSGTCALNGQVGCGTVFQITAAGSLTVLYSFSDPSYSNRSLIQATDGNFYGADPYAGSGCAGTGCGTIFRLTPQGAFTTLYSLTPTVQGALSSVPGNLIQATNGSFYGTTISSVFEFSIPLTLPTLPAIAAKNGVVNGASFQAGIGAGSWITINGANLAAKPDSWTVVNGVLPTMIDGVSVSVGGQPAYVEYVSPTQINALAPDIPAGTVPVTVTTSNGTSQPVSAQLSAESPAFFQWGSYAVATHQDFSLAVKNGTFPGATTVPAAPGDVIILWATGLGPTSPAAPAGMVTPSTTTYNTASTVSVTVGTATATVYGAALAPGYAGLYQIAIQIPASLANGDYPVVATINGASSPATTLITVNIPQ